MRTIKEEFCGCNGREFRGEREKKKDAKQENDVVD